MTSTPDDRARLRRPVFAGASLSALAQISAAVAGALVSVLLARQLGPSGVGAYNVLLSLLLVLLALGTLGVDFGISYFVSREEWSPGDAVRQIQLASLGLGALGIAAGAAVFFATRETAFSEISEGDVALVLGCLPFALSTQFSASLALALERYEMSAAGPVLQSGLSVVFIAGLSAPLGLQGAIAGFLLAYVITALTLAVRGARLFGAPSPGWFGATWRRVRRSIGFGFGVSLTTALGLLIQRVDIFILNAFASAATVGRYSLAFGLTTIQLLLPRALGQVILPRVASLGRDEPSDQSYVVRKSIRHAVILSLAAGVLTAAVLPLAPIVYGSSFRLTVPLGEVLVPGVAAMGLTSVMAPVLVGHGHPKLVTRLGFGGLVLAIALYGALIPPFEAWGAAVASTTAYAGVAAMYAVTLRRVRILTSFADCLPGRDEAHDYVLLARAVRYRATRRR